MLVSEFAKKYNESKQKSALVNKHIKKTYINYETKIALGQNIVDTCMYKTINGKKTFVPNTPLRYMLFVQAIIDEYTDLEWDTKDNEIDVLTSINDLEKYGASESIFAAIGDDITKFTTILNMIVDDVTDLNRSIVPFIETKFEALNIVFDTLSQAIEAPEIKDKIAEFIGKDNGVSEI